MSKMNHDPQMARYIRRVRKQNDFDAEANEGEEELEFNAHHNAGQQSQGMSSLHDQISYHGYAIEPFNMKSDENMGHVTADGYFVINRRRADRDAWLDSIGEDKEEELVDKMTKKIKEEQGFKNVYQGANWKKGVQNQIQQVEAEAEAEAEVNQKIDEKGREIPQNDQKQEKLTQSQIKSLLASKLPMNSTANKYLKVLKSKKNKQEYDAILYLCNEYIALTGDHEILCMKKEDLQAEEEEEEEEEQIDWDKEKEEEHNEDQKKQGQALKFINQNELEERPDLKNQIQPSDSDQQDSDNIF